MPYDDREDVDPAVLLYGALAEEWLTVLLFTSDEGRVALAAGFLWLATVVRVTVLLTELSTVAAACLLIVEFEDGAVTRVAVVLPLDAAADELTLLAEPDCDDAVLLTLLALATPPLVDTLLVNTLSEPVCLRSPCQRSSWWIGTVG